MIVTLTATQVLFLTEMNDATIRGSLEQLQKLPNDGTAKSTAKALVAIIEHARGIQTALKEAASAN